MTEDNTTEQEDVSVEEVQKEETQDLQERIRNLEFQLANNLKKDEKKDDADELPADVAQALAKDPNALAKWIKAQTNKGIQDVRQETQKQTWDRKAEVDFPSLKTDEKFKREVGRKINELLNNGEYSKDSPALIYRASELASLKFKDSMGKVEKKTVPTSLETTRTEKSDTKKSFTAQDDDPRLVFATMNGLRGEKLAKFKTFLEKYGPYETPKGKKARMVLGDK